MRDFKIIFLVALFTLNGSTIMAETLLGDTVSTTLVHSKQKKTFGQKLLTPFKWIAKNWSAYDPHYSLPSFYNWAGQLQNTSTLEWIHIEDGDVDMRMRSKMSNKFGPYFGYQWLFYGFTIDLNTIGKPKSKGKNEFTLSINSNLLNLDIIRRRTGGDFIFTTMNFKDGTDQPIDLKDYGEDYDIGDMIKNSITGFNLNIFTNHKKYSNPAAFSNGAVQLRSVGSPIVGFGYTHQKIESNINSLVSTAALNAGIFFGYLDNVLTEDNIERMTNIISDDNSSEEEVQQVITELVDITWPYTLGNDDTSRALRSMLTTRIPTTTRIDDWHLQLGYAYNLVFSRRLMLGLSLVAAPGIKRVHFDNMESLSYALADGLSDIIKKHEGKYVSPDEFRYDHKTTNFSFDIFARASLTFNHNRWRAGLMATYNRFLYNNGGTKLDNSYGNLSIYVGYCFGRKKEYRHGGALREDYIRAALTKRQIAEMKDTLPMGNIDRGKSYLFTEGKTTKYHRDEFDLNIFGCDLVKGPDGRYGWYEIKDGYVAPGQDTEERLKSGTVLDIDQDGKFYCEAGHDGSIRAGNWWKSQLDIEHVPNHWYPELLHYALKGKLTLYLRGRIFGTKTPIKVEIDDFCVNHGKDAYTFYQMGIQSFRSNSAYSIEGRANINGKDCRIYIEQKKRGKLTNMYVARLYEANKDWMKHIDGNRAISTISIPGTHDSGTSTVPEQPAAIFRAGHTQNFSISSQLADGIRAFDIRLKRDLHYGHTVKCRDRFDSTMVKWDRFLTENPSEFIIALIGSDEGGKWGEELISNFQKLIKQYPNRFVQDFSPSTPLDSVRGKVLVIKRQEECPFGRLLKFTDNAIFEYNGFHVEDMYKEHKTYKKIEIVEKHLREAYENEDPNKWYFTFNSIAWSPRRHNPYSYAWGGKAKNIRKPMNKSLREVIELKDYNNFGVVFLDFYNDHGDNPQIVATIIKSNFNNSYNFE